MSGYAEILGTVWVRSRGVIVATGAIALSVQFLADAPAHEKAGTVALLLGSVALAAGLVSWASRSPRPSRRIAAGCAAAALVGLVVSALGGIPVGGALVASLDAGLLLAPFAYCLACAAVDGLWSAPSAASGT